MYKTVVICFQLILSDETDHNKETIESAYDLHSGLKSWDTYLIYNNIMCTVFERNGMQSIKSLNTTDLH